MIWIYGIRYGCDTQNHSTLNEILSYFSLCNAERVKYEWTQLVLHLNTNHFSVSLSLMYTWLWKRRSHISSPHSTHMLRMCVAKYILRFITGRQALRSFRTAPNKTAKSTLIKNKATIFACSFDFYVFSIQFYWRNRLIDTHAILTNPIFTL